MPDAPRFQMPDLPVVPVLDQVREALDEAGAGVLVAPPGAGKTTLVPLALLDAEWLGGRKIVVLEPRRLATRAAARRMASLLGEDDVGRTVGYRMRMETGQEWGFAPKSIDFASMDQIQFAEFLDRVTGFIVTDLLPHIPTGEMQEKIESLLDPQQRRAYRLAKGLPE